MNVESRLLKRIYIVLFACILGIIFVVIPIGNTFKGDGRIEGVREFSEGWVDEAGNSVFIDEISCAERGGKIKLTQKLPEILTNTDCLCFESQNANLKVLVGGKAVYSFSSRENITGKGYGIAFHEAGICAEDAGKLVTLEYERVGETGSSGRILNMCICSPSDYILRDVRKEMFPCLLCVLTVFFGLFLMIIHMVASKKDVLPFDALALGTGAILLGIWLFLDTNIMQLVTGGVYVWRALSRIMPFTFGYPLIVFFNSMTKLKRNVYVHVGFWISCVFTLGIILVRYIYGIDMIWSFARALAAYVLILTVVVCVMVFDNNIYCRRTGAKQDYRYFIAGIIAFFISAGMDIIRYMFSKRQSDTSGFFTMIGMLIFVVMMLLMFLKWWMKDHEAIERDRFINRALQYAVSSNSPDTNIKNILEFLGKELKAERLFIFEDQKNGKFRGTYEWYNTDAQSQSMDLIYLPYEGYISKIEEAFEKNNNRILIRNPEECRIALPPFYNLMLTHHVQNIIVSPLEVGGKIFGNLGIVGLPPETLDSVADIMDLISYFLSQLVLQREDQNRAFLYNYKDALSGAGNLIAYRKYTEEELDMSATFGYVRCDIPDLDLINVSQSYEVGDQIVVVTAKCMMEVFGEQNVFRINGTQFAAFGFESEEVYFNNDVDRVKRMIRENSIEAFVASVYCIYGAKDLGIIYKRIDDLINDQIKNGDNYEC